MAVSFHKGYTPYFLTLKNNPIRLIRLQNHNKFPSLKNTKTFNCSNLFSIISKERFQIWHANKYKYDRNT